MNWNRYSTSYNLFPNMDWRLRLIDHWLVRPIIDRGSSVTSFTIGGAASKKQLTSPGHHATDGGSEQRTSSSPAEQELGQASVYVFCDKSHNKVS